MLGLFQILRSSWKKEELQKIDEREREREEE
jgi:hypothetical protein